MPPTMITDSDDYDDDNYKNDDEAMNSDSPVSCPFGAPGGGLSRGGSAESGPPGAPLKPCCLEGAGGCAFFGVSGGRACTLGVASTKTIEYSSITMQQMPMENHRVTEENQQQRTVEKDIPTTDSRRNH